MEKSVPKMLEEKTAARQITWETKSLGQKKQVRTTWIGGLTFKLETAYYESDGYGWGSRHTLTVTEDGVSSNIQGSEYDLYQLDMLINSLPAKDVLAKAHAALENTAAMPPEEIALLKPELRETAKQFGDLSETFKLALTELVRYTKGWKNACTHWKQFMKELHAMGVVTKGPRWYNERAEKAEAKIKELEQQITHLEQFPPALHDTLARAEKAEATLKSKIWCSNCNCIHAMHADCPADKGPQNINLSVVAERLVQWQMDTGKFFTARSGEKAPIIPKHRIIAELAEAPRTPRIKEGIYIDVDD